MKRSKKIKLESLNDSKFDTLNCELMTRLVDSVYDHTATAFISVLGGVPVNNESYNSIF